MTNRLRADKPNRHRAVAGALAGALALLMLSTAPAGAQPTQTMVGYTFSAPAGIANSISPSYVFDRASVGTNPIWTSVVFSTTDYYQSAGISSSKKSFYYQVKTNEQLNAMDEPPPDPFTVTVTATMTNDEGQTATATITYRTDWAKTPPPPGPVLSKSTANAPAGVTVSAFAEYLFDNAGRGAHLTAASFSTMEYYVEADTGIVDDSFLQVRAKTSEELNAMDEPPPNPFTVAVTVTMTNDAGQTATGTVDYTTSY